jgi:IS5 family transposase
MEKTFFDTSPYQDFPRLEEFAQLHDESTIFRFHRALEQHMLAEKNLDTVIQLMRERGLLLNAGRVVDPTLITTPNSSKNNDKKQDPDMHPTKKRKQWHFPLKPHIGVDVDLGLGHTVHGTKGNTSDIAEPSSLLSGQESVSFGDAGYQSFEKHQKDIEDVGWHVTMLPSKRSVLNTENEADVLPHKAEKLKAGILAKVEHLFLRMIKRKFGHVKFRYRGLMKNTAKLITPFALSSFSILRGELTGAQA